jgi:hypothetical protein
MNPERLLLAGALSMLAAAAGTAQVERSTYYRPELAVPEVLQPFLNQLEPGNDGFPLERYAKELEARLHELSVSFRGGRQAAGDIDRLLDPGFRGARLLPIDAEDGGVVLEVKRTTDLPRQATLDTRAFSTELRRLIAEFRDIVVAEFLITAIEAEGPVDSPSGLRTTVRYDIVGGGTRAYRVEHVGEWDMASREPSPTPGLHRDHRSGTRPHRLVPSPARRRPRFVDGDAGRGPHP